MNFDFGFLASKSYLTLYASIQREREVGTENTKNGRQRTRTHLQLSLSLSLSRLFFNLCSRAAFRFVLFFTNQGNALLWLFSALFAALLFATFSHLLILSSYARLTFKLQYVLFFFSPPPPPLPSLFPNDGCVQRIPAVTQSRSRIFCFFFFTKSSVTLSGWTRASQKKKKERVVFKGVLSSVALLGC